MPVTADATVHFTSLDRAPMSEYELEFDRRSGEGLTPCGIKLLTVATTRAFADVTCERCRRAVGSE